VFYIVALIKHTRETRQYNYDNIKIIDKALYGQTAAEPDMEVAKIYG
jgi:hypothetical protein